MSTTIDILKTSPRSLGKPKRFFGKTPRFWREAMTGWALISPWLIGFIALTLIPMGMSLYFCFTHYNGIAWPPRWAGFYNFEFMFKDSLFKKAVYNTVFFALISQPPAIIGSLILALLLNQRIPGKAAFRTIFYLPAVLPEVPLAMLWLWLLNPQLGLVNVVLHAIGIPNPPNWLFDADWAKPAMVVMRMWNLGIGAVIFLAGLQGIPEHLIEAAEVDGANSWQRFWHITIPMLSSTIFFQIVTSVIGVLQIFGVIYVWAQLGVGGLNAGPENSLLFYAYYLYRVAFETRSMGRASAMAWLLFITIMLLTLVQFRLSRRWVYYETGEG
jgi:multiple sugar transport system permease protein